MGPGVWGLGFGFVPAGEFLNVLAYQQWDGYYDYPWTQSVVGTLAVLQDYERVGKIKQDDKERFDCMIMKCPKEDYERSEMYQSPPGRHDRYSMITNRHCD